MPRMRSWSPRRGPGRGEEDLAGLAAEMYARSRPGRDEDDPGMVFEDRQVRVETTFDGAGVITVI